MHTRACISVLASLAPHSPPTWRFISATYAACWAAPKPATVTLGRKVTNATSATGALGGGGGGRFELGDKGGGLRLGGG